MASIGDNNRGVLITADSARRIAKVVQAYESGQRNVIRAKPLRTAADDGSEPVRIARVPAAWPKDTTLEVELIYESSCEEEDGGSGSGSGGKTLEVWNRLFDIHSGALVYIASALNGCWHVVAVSADCDTGSGSGCDCVSVGGQDLTTLPGYDASTTQILGHENGCLAWIDTTTCDGSS